MFGMGEPCRAEAAAESSKALHNPIAADKLLMGHFPRVQRSFRISTPYRRHTMRVGSAALNATLCPFDATNLRI